MHPTAHMGRARGLEEHGWETQGIQDLLRISQGTCMRSGVGSSSSLPRSSAVTGAAQMLLQCRRQPSGPWWRQERAPSSTLQADQTPVNTRPVLETQK